VKTLKPTDVETLKKNHLETLNFDALPDRIKKQAKESLYGEVKGSAMEKLEKTLIKEHGITAAKGTDWDNLEGLVGLIKKNAVAAIEGGDEALKAKIADLESNIGTLNENHKTALEELTKNNSDKLAGLEFRTMLAKYDDAFDIKEEDESKILQIKKSNSDYLKFMFDKDFELVSTDNGYVVHDKATGKEVRNDSMEAVPPSTVLNNLVLGSPLPLKESRKVNGRGVNGGADNADSTGSRGLKAKYGTWESFSASEEGKGLIAGSPESLAAYKEFVEPVK
jgi:hypothetical protein